MSELLSPIIGGIFTLLGIWLTNYLQTRSKPLQSIPSTTETQSSSTAAPATPSLRLGHVIRDIGIIWILTGLAGFVIGMAAGNVDSTQSVTALGLANIIFGSIGFAISGSLARSNRWKHLIAVAIGVWLTSFINVFLVGVSVGQWIISIFLVLVMMGIGGLISYIFNR